MSRSNSTEMTENPTTRFFQWSGKTGKVTYWDKELSKDIEVKLPFMFLVLDELHTIKGFSESEEKGISSNEVRDISKDVLNVKVGKNTIEKGLYSAIKDSIKAKGGKYAKATYIAYRDDNGKLSIGKFTFTGSSLSGGEYKKGKEKAKIGGWMDFTKTCDIYKNAVHLSLEEQVCTKGANEYRVPHFEFDKVSKETELEAAKLDVVLQTYLNSKLKARDVEHTESVAEKSNINEGLTQEQIDASENLPF